MKFKILDMSCNTQQKILLTYFFKDLNTLLDKNELLKLACICYDSDQKKLFSRTNRFKEELEDYKDKKISPEDIDDTLKKVVSDKLRLQEELIRCDLSTQNGIDHFYIAIIGLDFFQVEKEFRK